MSVDFPSFGLLTPMPGTFPEIISPEVSAPTTEVPVAEGTVVLDSAAVELATLVFDFISRFSNFSDIVAPEAQINLESETPSETENVQPDVETVAKNDFLDSVAEAFKYTTNTISDAFHPILEKLGNLAHLMFKNFSDSEPAKPTATAHTPSHVGKIGSNLGAKGTPSMGRVGSIHVPAAHSSIPRGCSLVRK